ncbi:MAG: protein-methionine-sulfoxide reductase catalytic subunit MsrP [Candidatus Eisenbacteria bacterium]|nr:protein-methionine-sulfoxide reductase catalytic subunit MsrP [Candidatus Eisenbacteria bacterium]
MHLEIRRPWELPGSQATPEPVYHDRRRFLKALGFAGAGALLGGSLLRAATATAGPATGAAPARAAGHPLYPAKRDARFALDRPLTDETVAARHNNYYEFTEQKDRVCKLVDRFRARPWRIEVAGLVRRPREIDVDDLMRALPIEERLYRHRCVEAWAMAVPWSGAPMSAFVKWAEPASAARFVRVVSFLKPDEAPNQKIATWYRWPYYEALRMDEAMNELAFLAFGVYGHDLPVQHGAPARLVTPWKYGYKSAKAMVRFEFTDRQPRTFWNDVAPTEYGFLSNVNPKVPHPRWSQATETMIGTNEKRPTLPYNGYARWVAHLYDAKTLTHRS